MEIIDKKFYAKIFKNINNTANIIIIFLIIQLLYQMILAYYGNHSLVLTFVIDLFLIPATHHIKQISYFYQYYLENNRTVYDE
jgi:hypothetical protein